MSEPAPAVALPVAQTAKTSVLVRMAERFGVDARKLHSTLKATAFKGDVSDEQFLALMIVADQYKLNPLTKEIYAFPDKNNGIVPVVGVDGWARIVNEHPQFDGMEFLDGPANGGGLPEWIECTIFRRDREHPVKVREYMTECKRNTLPWGTHPRRMLRHKSLIQCARLAFGFVGIYDQDEAERIIDGTATTVAQTEPAEIAAINAAVAPPKPAETKAPIDATTLTSGTVFDVTYAELAGKIASAQNEDDLSEVLDLMRSLPEAQRAEIDVEVRARRKELTK